MDIATQLPEHCNITNAPQPRFDGQAWVAIWVTECTDGLSGGEITIKGLENQRTDVLVRYPGPDGSVRSERLTPDRTSFVIPENPRNLDVVRTYLPLGFQHILEGLDHLLFVFALVLLVPGTRRLVGAITAFTVAHSITMAAATLGWLSFPSAPVEAVIALSIVFLASELIKRDESHNRLSERYPWTVSFAFGLLHGFGFAGALKEIGVPETDVPLALLSFNVGVEIGQLFFIAVIIAFFLVLRRLLPQENRSILTGQTSTLATAYFIGGLSSYWFMERFFDLLT